MTETIEVLVEGRTSSSKRRTFSEELVSTFSSPLAWILVLALLITWTCVFIILFDLTDSGSSAVVRKSLKDSNRRAGVVKAASDPVGLVKGAAEDSVSVLSAVLRFAASLVAPDDEDGNLYAVRKKGDKPSVLVVMHHSFNADYVVADSARLVDKASVVLTVDVVFFQDHLLDCPRNTAAWSAITSLLQGGDSLSWREWLRKYHVWVITAGVMGIAAVAGYLIYQYLSGP